MSPASPARNTSRTTSRADQPLGMGRDLLVARGR
jgi:hypothetical protein